MLLGLYIIVFQVCVKENEGIITQNTVLYHLNRVASYNGSRSLTSEQTSLTNCDVSMRKLPNINDILSNISYIQPFKITLCGKQLCKLNIEQLIMPYKFIICSQMQMCKLLLEPFKS